MHIPSNNLVKVQYLPSSAISFVQGVAMWLVFMNRKQQVNKNVHTKIKLVNSWQFLQGKFMEACLDSYMAPSQPP